MVNQKMWAPDDYIIHGRYCDTKSIQRALDKVRHHHRAVAAVLVVWQARISFQSLLLAAHQNPRTRRRLQAQLLKHPLEIHYSEGPRTDSELMKILLRRPPLSALEPLLATSNKVRTIVRKDSLEQRPAKGSSTERLDVTMNAILVGYGRPTREADQAITDLYCMVNASAPVRVQRDMIRIRSADKGIEFEELQVMGETLGRASDPPSSTVRLDQGLDDSSPQDALDALADALLKASLRLTRSTVGNVYFATQRHNQLRLAASVGNEQPRPILDGNETNSVVTHVYRIARPFLINDIDEFTRTRKDIQHLWVGRSDSRAYAELAVPLRVRPFGAARQFIWGVLNVEKVKGADSGVYTHHDLALLREIAMRLSLWRSNVFSALAVGSLARLTRRHTSLAQAWSDSASLTQDLPSALPEDVRPALADIAATLTQAYDLTRSISATVRLLSVDTHKLVRACTVGIPGDYDAIEVTDRKSVNAYVARSGRTCYIEDLRKKGYARDYPGLSGQLVTSARQTRCELCLPLVLHGRLIGTLNLESEHADAYSDTLHFAHAIAEQVSLSLAHARQSIEDVIWARTANAAVNTHELLKCIDALRALATSDVPGVAADLQTIANKIERAVEGTRVDGFAESKSVALVVDHVAAQLNMSEHVKWRRHAARDVALSPLRALATQLATTMVLDNAYNAAARSEQFTVSLYANERLVAGRQYLRLAIENKVLSRLPIATAQKLYRVPLRTPGRLHIGAFAAGAAMRAIGGDVFISVNDGVTMQTVIDVPIDE